MSLSLLRLEILRGGNTRARQADVEMQTDIRRNASAPLEDTAAFAQGLASPGTAVEPAAAPGVPAPDAAGGEAPASAPNSRRGRWTRSAISSRINAIRDQERQDNLARAFSRLNLSNHLRDIQVASAVPGPRGGPADGARGVATPSTSVAVLAAVRKEMKSRREREEASTLLGPNLAHYFGSGSSSSGTVGSSSSAANGGNAAASNTETTGGAFPPEPSGVGSRGTARLGSRGRARGASLSGLTVLGQLGEASDSQASIEPEQQQQSSAAPLEIMTEAVAMAEGIDIDVLKQWIEKSLDNLGAVQIDGTGEQAVERALHTHSHCTTLQSYVNLKRNSIQLMASSSEQGGVAATANGYHTSVPVAVDDSSILHLGHPLEDTTTDGEEAFMSARSIPTIQESEVRPARSLSMMPEYGSSALGSSLALGPSTHQLHFEYDCSSPAASIQIFIRASRKHGSWQTWAQKHVESSQEEGEEDAASASMYQQRGPAPHVLGWPVHSSLVKNGFAQPIKASLTLKLGLYAPPAAATRGEGGGSDTGPIETAENMAMLQESSTATKNLAAPTSTSIPIPEDETKEQRAVREKAEREVLKLSIVIEALNGSGRPYAEPNLQTTYMRLTSLPMRSSPNAEGTQEARRTWTAHVEGQEAEIGPHRFQLQEVYGLSSRPPPVVPVSQTAEGAEGDVAATGGGDGGAAGAAEDTFALVLDAALTGGTTGSECLICLSAPVNTLLLPCTHGLCLDCSVQLKDSVKAQRDAERKRGKIPKKKYNCPMCRREFTSMLHLRVADKEVEEEKVEKEEQADSKIPSAGEGLPR